jgi:Calcineurin-like phosphoesterase
MSEQAAECLAKPFRLGYVTDVEGNLDYFLSYVAQSKVLKLEHYSNQSLRLELKHPDAYFVFGGDSVDKGPGDIRLVRALVDLKRRYPDQVYLLVGNRDLNKLRFTAELSDQDMARPIADIPPPHWDPTAPSLLEYLQKKHAATGIPMEQLNTRLNRLHYMLEHTLGCPQTFVFRRQELALLQDKPTSDISDDEVLENFISEVENPKGSLRQYLECASVAVVIGNTLFCHGAVDCNTMRFVPRDDTKFENPPSKPPVKAMIDDVKEWTEALNQYLQEGLEDYQKRPLFNAERTTRGGESLMALQNRPAMWGRSIVSNCYGDGGCITTDYAARERNDPERVSMEATNALVFEKVSSDPMDPQVAEWLKKDGIQRVVVGHKPTGDCPAVLSALYTGVEIVSADTSFSDTSADDNRGRAMSVVEIAGDSPTDNQLEVRGTLRDGRSHESFFFRLHPGGVDVSVGDPNLGRLWKDGYWIKMATTTDSYWLSRGAGRRVEYKDVEKSAVLQSLQELTVAA